MKIDSATETRESWIPFRKGSRTSAVQRFYVDGEYRNSAAI